MIPDSIQITDGTTTLHIAPENLRIYFSEAATKLRERAQRAELAGDELLRAMEETILACARRNHPELTLEKLRDVLNVAEIGKIHNWVKTKSGLESGAPRPLDQGGAASPSAAPSSLDTSSTQPAGSQTTSSTA